ncbi:MAG: sulfatase-like hydrolase/transferase [Muribaculaceae bacterium]
MSEERNSINDDITAWLRKAMRPDVMLWVFPLLLLVANVALAFTEPTHWLSKAIDIVLPYGVFLLLTASSVKVGRSVLWCLPLMIYAAFQIVLLFLYGESIIAVDMFLNVFTTSVGEATELLANLVTAIATVCFIYIPPIVLAIIFTVRDQRASVRAIRVARYTAGSAIITGGVMMMVAAVVVPRYDPARELFPLNVVCNMFKAIHRAMATADYPQTSAHFDYHATATRPDSLREVYVVVVGETSRADNWQLAGYHRPTNPRLSQVEGLVFYKKAVSESNTTHKAVPLLLSPVSAATFADSIYTTRCITDIFGKVGYHTAFISNQQHNRSFIDHFSRQADTTIFLCDDGKIHYDEELLPRAYSFIKRHATGKTLVVLHTYGSHFKYSERYRDKYAVFKPDRTDAAELRNRDKLINAYDNTIVSIDAMLADITEQLGALGCPAALVYVSDHGEDIFDDDRERFLHSSPTPTYYQIHVPMLIWMSAEYRERYPALYAAATAHRDCDVATSESLFETMLSIAGITSPRACPSLALTDSSYTFAGRYYLNDYNERVPLRRSGLRREDFDTFISHGIAVQ